MGYMQDSYKSSEPSSGPRDGETEENIIGEYQPRKLPVEKVLKSVGANPPDEPDYEELFLRDAIRRAHDEELAALASLAVIRSGSNGRRMLTDSGTDHISHLKKQKETLEQIISESEGRTEK